MTHPIPPQQLLLENPHERFAKQDRLRRGAARETGAPIYWVALALNVQRIWSQTIRVLDVPPGRLSEVARKVVATAYVQYSEPADDAQRQTLHGIRDGPRSNGALAASHAPRTPQMSRLRSVKWPLLLLS